MNHMMKFFLKQLKKRRLFLGLKQKDLILHVGISRQQIESKGNPELSTFDFIAKGLKSELMLILEEKIPFVKANFIN